MLRFALVTEPGGGDNGGIPYYFGGGSGHSVKSLIVYTPNDASSGFQGRKVSLTRCTVAVYNNPLSQFVIPVAICSNCRNLY